MLTDWYCRSDEIYVETVKDKNTGQTLIEEIETAKMFHPTARQDSAFLARTATLAKRLAMRGDPSAPDSTFPRPYHPLFEDQAASNDGIIELLSNELMAAVEQAKRAEEAAKEYHAKLEVVKKIETACKLVVEVSERLDVIRRRLEEGTDDAEGDPPDVSNEACLQATRHGVYLSLMAKVLEELRQADEDAASVLRDARPALADIGRPGIDPKFAAESVASVDRLDELRWACSRARDVVTARVSTLQQARGVWAVMAGTLERWLRGRWSGRTSCDVRGWTVSLVDDGRAEVCFCFVLFLFRVLPG